MPEISVTHTDLKLEKLVLQWPQSVGMKRLVVVVTVVIVVMVAISMGDLCGRMNWIEVNKNRAYSHLILLRHEQPSRMNKYRAHIVMPSRLCRQAVFQHG